jgi:hypothetical protein
MTKNNSLSLALLAVLAGVSASSGTEAAEGARVIRFYGYDDCIQLRNSTTEVVLCPAAGGRVLKYALGGKNVLYLPAGDEGWTWDGGDERGTMNAGRFDIGPEQMIPRRQKLWQGKWKGEILGDRRARMISQVDEGPGVSLVRTFELASDSSQLRCTQTIVSASDVPVESCHWSRTFANGKGICVVPVSRSSRFPMGYVRYDPPGKMLNMQPQDDHVQRSGDFLIVSDHPENPKLGFDAMDGWLAYHSPQNLLFIKKFPTYPERAYNEVAGLTISIWYPEGEMVELEPIGPRERLAKRGDSASFTETWYLLDHTYPGSAGVQPKRVASLVEPLPR